MMELWWLFSSLTRYPREIFTRVPWAEPIGWFFTFVVPFLLVVNVPAHAMVKALDWRMVGLYAGRHGGGPLGQPPLLPPGAAGLSERQQLSRGPIERERAAACSIGRPWPRTTAVLVNLAAAVLIIAAVRSAADLIVPFLLALFLAAIITPSIDHLACCGLPALAGRRAGDPGLQRDLPARPGLPGRLAQRAALAAAGDPGRARPPARPACSPGSSALGLPIADGPGRGGRASTRPTGVRLLGGLLAGPEQHLQQRPADPASRWPSPCWSRSASRRSSGPIFGAESPAMARIVTILADLRRYMVIKTWISLATGIAGGGRALAAGASTTRCSGAVLAFLLNYVPNIGSLIAAIPPVVLALVQDGWPAAIGAAVLLPGGQLRGRLPDRAAGDGPEPRALDAGRLGLARLLGLGARAGRHVPVGPADDGLEDRLRRLGGDPMALDPARPVDRGEARRPRRGPAA